MDVDVAFCRLLMREATKVVKELYPNINLHKDCWVWNFHRDSWEFHGPDKFYWNGRADNAYHAKYQGWMAWLRSKGVDR